ncbi:hypothetical protein STEG23_017794, partial [Scotinomys teguina]
TYLWVFSTVDPRLHLVKVKCEFVLPYEEIVGLSSEQGPLLCLPCFSCYQHPMLELGVVFNSMWKTWEMKGDSVADDLAQFPGTLHKALESLSHTFRSCDVCVWGYTPYVFVIGRTRCSGSRWLFAVELGCLLCCTVPLPAVPYLYQLCHTFTSCTIPLPAVPYLYQLYHTFTSCTIPLPAVPYPYQLYIPLPAVHTFTSCAIPLPTVPYLYQLYIPLPAVPYLYQMYLTLTSCTIPLPAVPYPYQLVFAQYEGRNLLSLLLPVSQSFYTVGKYTIMGLDP